MVTRKTLEKYVNEAEVIAEEINETPEVVTKVLRQVEVRIENGRRQPKPLIPEGGISLRAAERKYGVLHSTISRWVARGEIPVILRTDNWVYIDENALIKKIADYRKNPGKGRKPSNN